MLTQSGGMRNITMPNFFQNWSIQSRDIEIFRFSKWPPRRLLFLQEALLWQRERATRLSVEILQLQNILFENYRVPGLSCSINCVILRLAVFTQYRSVTDTHTDRRTDRYSIASRGKNRPYCTAHQV